MRWFFILSGVCASYVAAVRVFAGFEGALPTLLSELSGTGLQGLVIVMWHVLSIVFGILALGLFLSLRLPRAAASAIASITAAVFGSACAAFLIVSYRDTGSLFAYYPALPLGITAILAAAAAFAASRQRHGTVGD